MSAVDEKNWNDKQIESLVEKAVRRSIGDADFRRLLVSDPRTALASIDARPLPVSLNLQFVEPGIKTRTIVLPPAATPSGELSDDQLERVAGGDGTSGVCNLTF